MDLVSTGFEGEVNIPHCQLTDADSCHLKKKKKKSLSVQTGGFMFNIAIPKMKKLIADKLFFVFMYLLMYNNY